MSISLPLKSPRELLLFIDLNLKLVDWNDEAAKILGIEEDSRGKLAEKLPLGFNYESILKDAIATGLTKELVTTIVIDASNLVFNVKILPSVKGVIIFASEAGGKNISGIIPEKHIYRSALDNLVQGCAIIDYSWRFIYINNTSCNRLNKSREEILFRTMFEVLPGFEKTLFFEAYNNAMINRVFQKIETSYVLSDETTRWFEASAIPLPEGILIESIDITERRHAEEQLRANEQKYKDLAFTFEIERRKLSAVIEDLPVGVGIGDSEGRTLSLNKAGLELHGFKSEEEMFSRLGDYLKEFELKYTDGKIIPVEDWPVNKALRGESISHYDTILINKYNHSEKIVSYSVVPVVDSKGKPVFFIYVMQDLTESKKTELALRESEEKLRTLADNISQLAWMADSTGSIVWYNKRWYDYTGTTFDEMKGWGWKAVHDPEHLDRVTEKFKKSIEDGTAWEDIFPLKSKNGEFRWFLSRALPVKDKNNNIYQWFGTNTDITGQKLLEQMLNNTLDDLKENETKLRDANTQIQDRLKEKDILLKELYHRTKNNMQVISSLLGLKASVMNNVLIREVFDDMRSRIRAIALVHEKLYQSGNLSRVNLSIYIKDLVSPLLTGHSIIPDQVELIFNLEPVNVLIDTAIPCGLMITELVLNSLKHAFPNSQKGKIEIILHKIENDVIELIVVDNGIGYNEKDIVRENLGLKLFKSIAIEQLNAEIKPETKNGVKWTIRFRDSLYKERI